jgi:MFS family permease
MIGMSVLIVQQGIAYGLSQSANSIGFSLGPIIGGSAAQIVNLRYIFGISTFFYLIIGLFAAKYVGSRDPQEVRQTAE